MQIEFNHITIKQVKEQTGTLCRQLRKREKLSQGQLAELLGLSRPTIQKLESGKNATLDTVFKVLQHFDLLPALNEFLKTQTEDNTEGSLY